MIPVSADSLQPNAIKATKIESQHWQQQLASAFKSPRELLTYLELDPNDPSFLLDSKSTGFGLKVPKSFAQLIVKGDKNDPLLQQVISLPQETLNQEGYSNDPLEEAQFNPSPGLIHKYHNRALLIAHQSCAVHCRYCFRRHFPYSAQQLNSDQLEAALTYLQQHSEINEIILSGGDPLSLSDAKIDQLLTKIGRIESIKTLRFHSRTPVVLPDRISTDFLNTLKSSSKTIVFVLHINHPNEIGSALAEKLALLKAAGVTLLNQSVLLKNINDNTHTLERLSQKLWENGVLPYYLHLLDPVQGAAHFNVNETTAIKLWQDLQASISGYLLPRLVREIPHRPSKTWINA